MRYRVKYFCGRCGGEFIAILAPDEPLPAWPADQAPADYVPNSRAWQWVMVDESGARQKVRMCDACNLATIEDQRKMPPPA